MAQPAAFTAIRDGQQCLCCNSCACRKLLGCFACTECCLDGVSVVAGSTSEEEEHDIGLVPSNATALGYVLFSTHLVFVCVCSNSPTHSLTHSHTHTLVTLKFLASEDTAHRRFISQESLFPPRTCLERFKVRRVSVDVPSFVVISSFP